MAAGNALTHRIRFARQNTAASQEILWGTFTAKPSTAAKMLRFNVEITRSFLWVRIANQLDKGANSLKRSGTAPKAG